MGMGLLRVCKQCGGLTVKIGNKIAHYDSEGERLQSVAASIRKSADRREEIERQGQAPAVRDVPWI